MSQSLVPVIDIAPFLAGGRADKARVAAEVDDACREIGFLIIAGHGVAQAQIDEMRGVTRAFFELPHWEKLRVKMPPDRYRGLMTVGSEDTAYSMDDEAENAPDWRESFVIGPHDHAYDDYHYGPGGWRFFAANFWPDRPVEMRPLWEAYYREMERLAGDLMRIFACALGLPESFFADKIDRHITNFIASYYPPQTTPPLPGQLRCGAHADYGSLTIVTSDTPVGGLQVLGKDGTWSDVPCIPGTFVINLGDLMAEWTNDRWRSTLHRVVNPPPCGGRQQPAFAPLLPPAQLRCRDRVFAELHRSGQSAALRAHHVGRPCRPQGRSQPAPPPRRRRGRGGLVSRF